MTFSSTAPAHPHATGVAMYPALFFIPIISVKDNKAKEQHNIENNGLSRYISIVLLFGFCFDEFRVSAARSAKRGAVGDF